jgi:hypothetical protein
LILRVGFVCYLARYESDPRRAYFNSLFGWVLLRLVMSVSTGAPALGFQKIVVLIWASSPSLPLPLLLVHRLSFSRVLSPSLLFAAVVNILDSGYFLGLINVVLYDCKLPA